ncbi:hypothetical protein [Azospirillum palustre]
MRPVRLGRERYLVTPDLVLLPSLRQVAAGMEVTSFREQWREKHGTPDHVNPYIKYLPIN